MAGAGAASRASWSRWTGPTQQALFSGRESFGWDECLPTTAACADPLAAGQDLRDHGDQWGRGAYLRLDHEQGAVEHTWAVPRWDYRLHRRLSFADAETLLAEYVVESHAQVPLPIHWAQHPVLRVEPGSYIDLPEVHTAYRSWQNGIDLPPELSWPKTVTADGHERDLACVRTGEGWAAVLYAEPREGTRVVAPDGARLDLEWDQDFAPALRIWLCLRWLATGRAAFGADRAGALHLHARRPRWRPRGRAGTHPAARW